MPSSADRQYISRWATDVLGMVLHVRGVPTDADGSVMVKVLNETTHDTVLDRPASRVAPGTYELQLTGEETENIGEFSVRWSYQIQGADDVYWTYVEIVPSSPAYDALDESMKVLVDRVWIRFADLFDSPTGGPNLLAYAQSHFTRGRLADLLRMAVGRLNTAAQPYQTYTIDGQGGAEFPVATWGALLEQATYVECIKHLRRSYTEQPAFQGSAGGARLDRRDYWDRWGAILTDEEKQLKSQLDTFKIANMGLGKAKALVSGGAYGKFGPTRLMNAAPRARFWSRYY